MFVVGLRLRPAALRGVLGGRPKALVTGLVVQLLALPVVALLLGTAFGLTGPMLLGLVLVAAAPGGVTSNYIAHLARAELALSAAMTLVTTALASITIPLVLGLTGGLGEISGASGLTKLSMIMLVVAVAPMALGMGGLAVWKPRWAEVILTGLEPVAKLVFAAMVLATFVQNWGGPMQENLGTVGPAVILLNLVALGLAFAAGQGMGGLTTPDRRAIMVEASLQNVAVALFVAGGAVLGQPAASVPALIYAMMMNLSALVQIMAGRRDPAVTPPAE